ncbi:MAG: HAMP domain-containing sensor histidine kinase [Lacisediminihabitans sp.]
MQLTVASAIVVAVIITTIYLFIITQVKPGELFELVPDPNDLEVNAGDVLRGALLLGVVLIVSAGFLSWFVTRQAVRPLGDALRIQRAFVADASHELRTPLTVLDARLQILQRGLAEADPSADIVGQLREDTKSLIGMVNDLLLSAEVEGTQSRHGPATPLSPVIAVVVSSMQLIADGKAVTITVDEPQQVWTLLPGPSVHRCLVALLDNALRFAPDGSEVTVGVIATHATVTISVLDHGPGIRGIEPDRIFDRFARTREAAAQPNASRAGFGIGLALVRDIVTRNGGSVAVEQSSERGTKISFSIPRARTN